MTFACFSCQFGRSKPTLPLLFFVFFFNFCLFWAFLVQHYFSYTPLFSIPFAFIILSARPFLFVLTFCRYIFMIVSLPVYFNEFKLQRIANSLASKVVCPIFQPTVCGASQILTNMLLWLWLKTWLWSPKIPNMKRRPFCPRQPGPSGID